MFNAGNFIQNINDIPSSWIFEKYLNLPEPLMGQKVNIRSVFNNADKSPSMYISYHKANARYFFECFSTGRKGGAIDMLMELWNMNFRDTADILVRDYSEYIRTGKFENRNHEISISEFSEWKVTDFKTRTWTKGDEVYWTKYGIGSAMLNFHNVKPIASYTFTKYDHEGNVLNSFVVEPMNGYGYFSKDGTLCKIYQPLNKQRKFVKIKDYIQGTDQLQGHDTLMITSSLKDIMTIKALGLKLDIVAADSENVLIDEETIKMYLTRYSSVITYMDSDTAGIKSMQSYHEKYNLFFVYMPLEKDISDIRSRYGHDVALRELYPKIQNAINKSLGIN